MHYSILYRGPLSSCNYGCEYCPFAKHQEGPEELAADERALARFIAWVRKQGARGHEISVLFTPWGEALIRRWYQEGMVELTGMPHVRKAAIQTNLSCRLDWTARCDRGKLGLWCTYHPTETSREKFLARCRELGARQVRYSVGVVGLKEHADDLSWLRRELPAGVYVWVNAFKRQEDYYSAEDLEQFTAIDPLFPMNAVRHASRGEACRCGESVFAVDGEGTMRRCHFIKTPIGNIYADGWERALSPQPCSNDTCGCHIGYVHMPSLRLDEVFGEGILERIPAHVPPPRRFPLPALMFR
jgi:MoaA/NifB/PqqE/SkfB family radical SAM enzyme